MLVSSQNVEVVPFDKLKDIHNFLTKKPSKLYSAPLGANIH